MMEIIFIISHKPVSRNPIDTPCSARIAISSTMFLHQGAAAVATAVRNSEKLSRHA